LVGEANEGNQITPDIFTEFCGKTNYPNPQRKKGRLLVGGMEILFLILAATIFGVD
jgi:hypothetical protein